VRGRVGEFDGSNELYVIDFWQCRFASSPARAGEASHLCVDPFPERENPDYDFAET